MAFYKSNFYLVKILIFSIFILKINARDASITENNIYPHDRKLVETYSRGKLDGLVKLYYSNGKPEWRFTFYEGILHGLATKWSPTGIIQIEGYFNNGDSSGVWRWFNHSGKITNEKDFKNNIYKINSQAKRYTMKITDI